MVAPAPTSFGTGQPVDRGGMHLWRWRRSQPGRWSTGAVDSGSQAHPSGHHNSIPNFQHLPTKPLDKRSEAAHSAGMGRHCGRDWGFGKWNRKTWSVLAVGSRSLLATRSLPGVSIPPSFSPASGAKSQPPGVSVRCGAVDVTTPPRSMSGTSDLAPLQARWYTVPRRTDHDHQQGVHVC